jgi:hypothetical protein
MIMRLFLLILYKQYFLLISSKCLSCILYFFKYISTAICMFHIKNMLRIFRTVAVCFHSLNTLAVSGFTCMFVCPCILIDSRGISADENRFIKGVSIPMFWKHMFTYCIC